MANNNTLETSQGSANSSVMMPFLDTRPARSKCFNIMVIFILFFVNLINYIDRYTIAGKLPYIYIYIHLVCAYLQFKVKCNYIQFSNVYFYTDFSKINWLLFKMYIFCSSGFLPDIEYSFDISSAEAGFIQTAFVIVFMVVAPIYGYLGDRFNRKYLMASGVFLWSLTTLIGSFMPVSTFSICSYSSQYRVLIFVLEI